MVNWLTELLLALQLLVQSCRVIVRRGDLSSLEQFDMVHTFLNQMSLFVDVINFHVFLFYRQLQSLTLLFLLLDLLIQGEIHLPE